ncbi:MAG: twin-arginine translocase TatA/TatE family subunit [Actinomycetaceae bacterium]
MGGISGSELIVLLLVGFLVVGPEKLPDLSRQLARVVVKIREVARDTQSKVRDELGDDLEEWKNLDPRQYDPRRIVADAMREPAPRRTSSSGPTTQPGSAAALASGAAAAAGTTSATGPASATVPASAPGPVHSTTMAGFAPQDFDPSRHAPFDPDAT